MPHHPRTRTTVVCVAVLLLAFAALPASRALADPPYRQPARGAYRPPVVAPITDPFRAPSNPYGPGNRGIEYATPPGTPVGAAGAGVVVFAGPVAGNLYVTVLHPDGIRTSYSYLAAILVSQGQVVSIGEILGLSGARLHVGARVGDAYIDPARLWGRPHVALVPLHGARTLRGAF